MMKKWITRYPTLILLSLSLSLYGAKDSECCREPIPLKHNYLQSNLGIDFNYARYKLGALSDMSGYLAGLHVDFYYKKPRSALVGLYFDGRWNAGHICSDINCCNFFDLRSCIDDYMTSFHLGYNATTCDDTFMLTPFSGVGFYFLSNKLNPNIIEYKYFNVYVPLGMEFQWDIKDHFNVGLNATYRLDAHTRVKMILPCIKICEKIKLKRSHGFKLEIPLIWNHTYCKRVNFQTKVVPFFDWNKFGASKKTNRYCIPIQIPCMKRWHLGLSVLIGISF
ncbi:hypothetical protein ACFLYA_00535 [Candidatus Dependentiae bacterium]